MEVVNQRKVPGVVCVDLVVRGHLHPLFEVCENRDSLHRRNCASANDDTVVIFVDDCSGSTAAGTWRLRPGATGRIFDILQAVSSLAQRCRSCSLQLVLLALLQSMARLRSSGLLFDIIVEGDSEYYLVALLDGGNVGESAVSQTYLTGEFLKGEAFIDPEVALTLPARGTLATRGILCCRR